MSVTLQLFAETATTIQAAMPAAVPAAGSLTDQANSLLTNISSLVKIGVPLIGGIVVLILGIRAGFKFGKIIGLGLVAALVLYLSIGGGLVDISNMLKAETTAGASQVPATVGDPDGVG
ncbi:hypothetical protein [Paenarthrobacter nicotinovorans]|uniref:hypothetical protein n=1 Tax=Paenarthrobacter nicotinovorans TaxID=29320 RepID=UPI0011A4908D|nr:hypothetical protein [Paenarthrobacter nicotinovorans]